MRVQAVKNEVALKRCICPIAAGWRVRGASEDWLAA